MRKFRGFTTRTTAPNEVQKGSPRTVQLQAETPPALETPPEDLDALILLRPLGALTFPASSSFPQPHSTSLAPLWLKRGRFLSIRKNKNLYWPGCPRKVGNCLLLSQTLQSVTYPAAPTLSCGDSVILLLSPAQLKGSQMTSSYQNQKALFQF